MAYDEELAGRIRALVGGEPGVEEKKMFGGLGFLVGGNMAVAASGQGGCSSGSIPKSRRAWSTRLPPTRWRCAAVRWRAGYASTRSTSPATS